LIKSLAADEHCYSTKVNAEDAHIAYCLRKQGLVKFSQPLDIMRIYDDPSSKAEWSHEYTKNTLMIHRLKKDSIFLGACNYFMKNGKK
jgi:hypothetical protein